MMRHGFLCDKKKSAVEVFQQKSVLVLLEHTHTKALCIICSTVQHSVSRAETLSSTSIVCAMKEDLLRTLGMAWCR